MLIRHSYQYPVCQRVFFPCCLRRKLSDEAAIVKSGFFFPLITIAASPLNFRRKQQEKNPLAPRVSYQFSSLYNVYKEKPIFQNITKKHVHVIFPVLILFVQSTHMERIWVTGRDRVGRTCLENFACLWKYPATRLFSSTKEKHQPSFGLRHLCENRTT